MNFVAHHDGKDIPVEVERQGSGYRVRIGERWIEADLIDVGGYVRVLRFEGGTQFSLIHHREGNRHHITLGGATIEVEVIDPLALRRRESDDDMGVGGMVKTLMPGRVVRVLVSQGQAVQKGAGLLILEAMKMENEIQASVDGVVDEIFVSAGDTVDAGAPLCHIG